MSTIMGELRLLMRSQDLVYDKLRGEELPTMSTTAINGREANFTITRSGQIAKTTNPALVWVQYDDDSASKKHRPKDRKFLNRYVQVEASKRKKLAARFKVKPDTKQLKTFLHRCPIQCRAPRSSPPPASFDIPVDSRYRSFDILVCPVCKSVIEESPDTSNQSSNIPSFLDGADIDPFHSGAVKLDRIMNGTLHYYLFSVFPTVWPSNFPKAGVSPVYRWVMPLVFAYPSLLYTALFIATANLFVIGGSAELQVTERDAGLSKLKLLQTLNSTLSKPSDAVNASTIIAVAGIAHIAVHTGNLPELHAHLDGLEKILAMRGGFDGIPPLLIETTICKLFTMAFRNIPRKIPLPEAASIAPDRLAGILSNSRSDPSFSQLADGLLEPQMIVHFDYRMRGIIQDYLETLLCREFLSRSESARWKSELESTSIRFCRVIREAMWAAWDNPQDPSEYQSSIQETCRLALIVFYLTTNQTQHMLEISSGYRAQVVTKLKKTLESSDLSAFWGANANALVWILLLGAYLSSGHPERTWYIMGLVRGAQALALRDWQHVRNILLRFLYLDRVFEAPYKRIWDEVELLVDVGPSLWHVRPLPKSVSVTMTRIDVNVDY